MLVRVGLPRNRFHDLRPAYATLLIEAGADRYAVSRGLGNRSIATTANVYAHLTDVMRQRVADRMDGILGSEAG